jgi:hypothetical protein
VINILIEQTNECQSISDRSRDATDYFTHPGADGGPAASVSD